MKFVYSDGGRSNYFKAENVGDCVCRAICNAGGYDYKDIYNRLNAAAKAERTAKHPGKRSSARDGMYKDTRRKVLEELGWEWHPTMNCAGFPMLYWSAAQRRTLKFPKC